MRVLVGCEESQTVCTAFRDRGDEAYSCDLVECSGGHPDWHLQMDVSEAIDSYGPWDLIILHPDCTKLAVSGNRWYGEGTDGHPQRIIAMKWTATLWDYAKAHCNRVALENPIGVLGKTSMGKPTQYIHPWEYGHGETKKTCLWLHNLRPLRPTNIVEGRENLIWKMPPSSDRKRLRSKTYQGWADAMAHQWGG